jgi:hypothetical protein
MPTGQDYYLLINNVPHGPYTAEQIQGWIRSQSSQADLNSVFFAIAGSSNWEPITSFCADLNGSSGAASDAKESVETTTHKKIKLKKAVVLFSFSIGFIFICFAIFNKDIFRDDSNKSIELPKDNRDDSNKSIELPKDNRDDSNKSTELPKDNRDDSNKSTELPKDNKIKVKGIYLGMNIEDACSALQNKFSEIPELSSIKLSVLDSKVVGWGKLPSRLDQSEPVKFITTGSDLFPSWVIAGEDAKVFMIQINIDLVEALYKSKEMEHADFIRTFMKVNGIAEMDKKAGAHNVEWKYLSPIGEQLTIVDIPSPPYRGCAIHLVRSRSIQERLGDFK